MPHSNEASRFSDMKAKVFHGNIPIQMHETLNSIIDIKMAQSLLFIRLMNYPWN